jgi:sugar lactone lactonase YvrE
LLLLAVPFQKGKAWGGNMPPTEQDGSSHFAPVRTYAPEEFRQSVLDRLSGGLPRKFPYRMATDSRGRVLVTDPDLSVVHVFDTKHQKRWAIRGDHKHRLSLPSHIALDSDDNIYVTDVGRSAVLVFEPDGRFKREIGIGLLCLPTGISVDKQHHMLYVADWWSGAILSFDLEGHFEEAFGTLGRGTGQLYQPSDIALDRGTLLVLDTGNSRFEQFDLHGHAQGIRPFGANRTPIALAVDDSGHTYYVDADSGGLVSMDRDGKVLSRFAAQREYGQWISRHVEPEFRCVAVDAEGNILALRPTLQVEVVKAIPD